jgi:hypothetical protein
MKSSVRIASSEAPHCVLAQCEEKVQFSQPGSLAEQLQVAVRKEEKKGKKKREWGEGSARVRSSPQGSTRLPCSLSDQDALFPKGSNKWEDAGLPCRTGKSCTPRQKMTSAKSSFLFPTTSDGNCEICTKFAIRQERALPLRRTRISTPAAPRRPGQERHVHTGP